MDIVWGNVAASMVDQLSAADRKRVLAAVAKAAKDEVPSPKLVELAPTSVEEHKNPDYVMEVGDFVVFVRYEPGRLDVLDVANRRQLDFFRRKRT